MKTAGEKGKNTSGDLDIRVRDRNVANGVVDPKTLERYLNELPDVETQSEVMPIDQPALGGSSGDLGRGGSASGST